MLASKKIDGFDGDDFLYPQRLHSFAHRREAGALGKNQREIALDGGEARNRPILPRLASQTIAFIKRIESPFGEKNVLPQLEFLGNASNELPRMAPR